MKSKELVLNKDEKFTLHDSLDLINEFYYKNGWTDGLPIIPPTEDRIKTMISESKLKPDEIVALVPPRWGMATVHKIAINAVMAGCKPEYMPALIAVIKALAQEEFNLYGIQATTNAVAPLVIFNGPIISALDINYGYNALGPGWLSNATIGRAVRLILINIGGAVPGYGDYSTIGQPGKYTFCIAENEHENPWDPFHIERGFSSNVSTVTTVGVTSIINIVDFSDTGEEILKSICKTMLGTGGNDHLSGGEPFIAFSPEHASVLYKDNWTKNDIKNYIFNNSKIPILEFSIKTQQMIKIRRKDEKEISFTNGSLIPISPSPDDIQIIVLGGPSVHSAVFLTFGTTRSVTIPV